MMQTVISKEFGKNFVEALSLVVNAESGEDWAEGAWFLDHHRDLIEVAVRASDQLRAGRGGPYLANIERRTAENERRQVELLVEQAHYSVSSMLVVAKGR